jgi:hypothetical protein
MEEDIPVTINGTVFKVRFENGMTGIRSRVVWINNKKFGNAVLHTDDLTVGNHLLYSIRWRDSTWDKVLIFISESLIDELINDNKWREPILIKP